MSTPSDADLIAILRRQSAPQAEMIRASEILLDRYLPLFTNYLHGRITDCDSFFAICNQPSMEDFAADVFWRAVKQYDPAKGSFKTFAFAILRNALNDGFRSLQRRPHRQRQLDHPDAPPVASDGLTPEQQAILGEIVAEVKACLAKLGEDKRRAVVWLSLLQLTPKDLAEVWTDQSHANIRQLHTRGLRELFTHWMNGRGATLVEAGERFFSDVGPMTVDPERIQNARAREAYRAWVAGEALDAPRRELVLDALEELLKMATHRAPPSALDLTALEDGDGLLSEYLEIGRDRKSIPEDRRRLCDAINRQLLFMRMALGLARPSEATASLGALLHERVLADGGDYDAWAKSLDLSTAAFRRLLGDDLEPTDALVAKLTKRLGMTAEAVRRAAARRETRSVLRQDGQDDLARRIRDRVLARLGSV